LPFRLGTRFMWGAPWEIDFLKSTSQTNPAAG
jgi:hypothetical protein